MKAIVKINPQSIFGKSLLSEIHGLKEGDVVEGERQDNAFVFKHKGSDCVLWFGDNCEPYKGRRKAMNNQ